MSDADRLDAVVDRLTFEERIDLARALEDWRAARELPDALEPLRRALDRRDRRELREIRETDRN